MHTFFRVLLLYCIYCQPIDNGQGKRYKSEKKVRNRVYKHESLRRKKRRYSWEENDQGYDADMMQVMTNIPQHLQKILQEPMMK